MTMKHINNCRGSALPMVLIIFVVLFLLGTALLQLSLSDTNQASWQNNKVQAHYLGRSGVQHGIKILQAKLSAAPYNDTIQLLASQLQATVSNPYTITGVGQYTIEFSEGDYSGELKITSVGTVNGKIIAEDTVTYTRKLGTDFNFTDPSGIWMTGINLEKGIDPNDSTESYLGHAALLESKNSKSYIQSPKGSTNPSTYRASLILLRDYQGRSLRQVTNSIDLTFDAEIVYFIGDVQLNKNNTPIVLTVSEPVLKQRTYEYDAAFPNPTGSPSTPPGRSPIILDYGLTVPVLPDLPEKYRVGFEDLERYRTFISEPSATRTTTFPAGKYGVVKLGGGIKDDDGNVVFPVTGKGYYYFQNGVNLRNPSGKLIQISDSDPIVDVLDSILGVNMGISPALWNDH